VLSGKGIYRDKKPVGAAEKVLKSRVHLILLGSMSAYYSRSRLCLVVPKSTSVYYLQITVYYLQSTFGGSQAYM
jgi:hypothetical protein